MPVSGGTGLILNHAGNSWNRRESRTIPVAGYGTARPGPGLDVRTRVLRWMDRPIEREAGRSARPTLPLRHSPPLRPPGCSGSGRTVSKWLGDFS